MWLWPNDRERQATAYEVACHRWERNAMLANRRGREAAVWLYQRLAAGYPPPCLPVASPDGSPVHLDTVFDYARWSAAEVRYPQYSGFAVGPPLFTAAAIVRTALVNRHARQLAEDLSLPQWRSQGRLRLLVTATDTWCMAGNGWHRYPHATVTGYEVAAEVATVWMRDAAPLRLAGPGVWCHAVLVAYGLFGLTRWQQAPWLEPIRDAAATYAPTLGG